MGQDSLVENSQQKHMSRKNSL
jgi:hypothetical protein